MAHVTFVHGISNKPPPDDLLRAWVAALADDGGVDLDYENVTSGLVYWADLLYAAPLAAGEAESLESVDLHGAEDADVTWLADSAEEAAVMGRLASRIGFLVAAIPVAAGLPTPSPAMDESLELPPPPIARRVMKTFLRNVHHYLFNVRYSPRPNEAYAIQDCIRQRVLDAFRIAAQHEPPILRSLTAWAR
jgi:hypothetical protein